MYTCESSNPIAEMYIRIFENMQSNECVVTNRGCVHKRESLDWGIWNPYFAAKAPVRCSFLIQECLVD